MGRRLGWELVRLLKLKLAELELLLELLLLLELPLLLL
jgi:hypothetical protein